MNLQRESEAMTSNNSELKKKTVLWFKIGAWKKQNEQEILTYPEILSGEEEIQGNQEVEYQ